MNSVAIEKAYKAHLLYKNRIKTDTFFTLPAGSVAIKGRLDKAIRFVEDYQLLNPALWAKFVMQFKNTSPKADDADNGWRGEYWGKMMRGACFTYRYTKNRELYDILAATVRDMMSAADENGRISSYSVAAQYDGWDMWCRKYVMLGMQYFIEICEDEALIAEITASLKGQADYLISTVGYESEGKTHITRTSTHWHGMNSSSILEPIVRTYNLTGEKKYLDFASYIVDAGVIYDEGVSIFEMAYENELPLYKYPVTKAYEMMSCFEGLLEFYRVTGVDKWRTAVINFTNRVKNEEISVIGSAGCTHELFDNTASRQCNTEYNGIIQETCVTVTYMKLCYQLLCLTGDSAYADEIENSLYNAYLGTINYNKSDLNGGLPFDSYSPLLFNNRCRGIGGQKIMADGSYYGCCACIGSAGTGLIGMQGAMMSKDGVVINTYANEKITAMTPSGEKLVIKVVTEYPIDGIVNFEIQSDCESECAIMLRIPAWSKKSLACLNGEYVSVKGGEYAVFNNTWRKGDYITLSLDMRAKVIKALDDASDVNAKNHVAIKRGPLMLAKDKRLACDLEGIVELAPDGEGYVECNLVNSAKSDYYLLVNVKNSDNTDIPMCDYASAGSTWDDKSMTTVWLPTASYNTVDLSKEIVVTAPNMWGLDAGKYPFTFDNALKLMIGAENSAGERFALWSTGEDRYLIRSVSSGMYLVLNEEGQLTLGEKGDEFALKRFVQNRYKIAAPNGLELVGPEDTVNPYITLAKPSCEASHVFRIEQAID